MNSLIVFSIIGFILIILAIISLFLFSYHVTFILSVIIFYLGCTASYYMYSSSKANLVKNISDLVIQELKGEKKIDVITIDKYTPLKQL